MQAGERTARQMRWQVWHTAALPLLKRFPNSEKFIDPDVKPKADLTAPGAKTFMALRALNGDQPPDWVLEKFGLLNSE